MCTDPHLPQRRLTATHLCYSLSRSQGHTAGWSIRWNPMTSSEIEPIIFRLTACYLSQLGCSDYAIPFCYEWYISYRGPVASDVTRTTPGSKPGHYTQTKQSNSVTLSPQANFTDWSTATCRRNLVPTFVDRGVSRGQRGGTPTVVNLSFLDRSRYFSFK
jgi:hypothetical protein